MSNSHTYNTYRNKQIKNKILSYQIYEEIELKNN